MIKNTVSGEGLSVGESWFQYYGPVILQAAQFLVDIDLLLHHKLSTGSPRILVSNGFLIPKFAPECQELLIQYRQFDLEVALSDQ